MKTNAMQVAQRIEGVLASDQWGAILASTSGRMKLGDITSFKLKEELDSGVLSFVLNYELGEKGIFLSTYDGKFILDESIQHVPGDKVETTIERNFNAEGRYVFSIQEAINLLEGRSVLKPYVSMDGVEKIGWLKAENGTEDKPLQFYFTGGQAILPAYDLDSVLQKLPMGPENREQRGELVSSLQSGDLQQIVLGIMGKEAIYFLQADPASKSVAIFDEQKKRLQIQQLKLGGGLVNARKNKSKGLSMG